MAMAQPWFIVFRFGECRSLQYEERRHSIPKGLESEFARVTKDRIAALLTQFSGSEDRLKLGIYLDFVLGPVCRKQWEKPLYGGRRPILKRASEPTISTFPGLPRVQRHVALV